MQKHITVLKKEAVDFLNVVDGGVYFDMTFGNGGHSEEILLRSNKVRLFCIDRDESAKANFERLKKQFPNSELNFIHSRFSDIEKIKNEFNIEKIDGFLFDFGVSSMQLDEGERGFSFSKDAPLSMQMGLCKISAFDFVNFENEKKISDVIFKYSDEKKSRQIARKICESRKVKKIETTLELATIVKQATGKYNDTINPATRTFQAIRIFVNNEMSEIEMAINSIYKIATKNTRCSCISFHSLEDSIIKKFIKEHNKEELEKEIIDKNYGILKSKSDKIDKIKFYINQLHQKVILPSDEEIKNNIRSRSAKMRAFEFIENENFKP